MKKLSKKIVSLLTKKKMNISFAESCTGGMVSSKLTSISGSSVFFDGAIVSYSNSFKSRLLNVPKSIISKHGAVSHQTALSMVKGLEERLNQLRPLLRQNQLEAVDAALNLNEGRLATARMQQTALNQQFLQQFQIWLSQIFVIFFHLMKQNWILCIEVSELHQK